MPEDSKLKALSTREKISARSYWKKRLLNFKGGPYFNGHNNSPTALSGYEECTITADDLTEHNLRALAPSDKARHIVLLSALGILTEKSSLSSDVIIFTPLYADHHLSGQKLVVPVRMNNFYTNFKDFLLELKDNLIQDFDHCNYAIDDPANLEIKKTASIMMVLEDIQATIPDQSPGIIFSFNTNGMLLLKIVYDVGFYNKSFIKSLGELYFDLLFKLTEDKTENIKNVEIISEKERKLILHEFVNPFFQFSNESSSVLFENQVDKLPNASAYILGKNLELLPIGIIGEIYFAGSGINKEDLDEEIFTINHFVPNPFLPGQFIYKTGHSGILHSDGAIRCMGVIDKLPDQKSNFAKSETAEAAVERKEVVNDSSHLNEINNRLVSIWSEVLKIDKQLIDITKSFFALGGHSLKAAVLINRINKELNVDVSLKDIFKNRNISSLAKFIQESKKLRHLVINKAKEKEYYPLSSAQKRLYFLYEFDQSSLAYNVFQAVKLEGFLDRERFDSSFRQLIMRHESLRTCFGMVDDVPVQRILESVDFEVSYLESDGLGIDAVIGSFCRPFVLNEAPLLRAGLIALSRTEHVLVMDMHHIITDGTSLGILVRDFMSFYNGELLPVLKLQYKDYAEWQQGEMHQGESSEQEAFWLGEFSHEPSVLQLPLDYARPAVKGNGGDSVGFDIGPAETDALRALAEGSGATLFMVVMSLFNVFLSRLGNQEDVVVGIPTAGRPHADLENIIGMFVNTLPVRNYPMLGLGFRSFLGEVRAKVLGCFQNQSYQYEQLIERLKTERDTGRNPLFDVMLVYHNFENPALEIPGLKIDRFGGAPKISKFDITLSAFERSGGISFDFGYCTELFGRSTIERFIGYFRNIVSAVIADADVPIGSIDLPGPAERLQLVEGFNRTGSAYPKEETLVSLFDRQVGLSPGHTAFTYKGERMSYKGLHEESSRIACYLAVEKGVVRGDLVGIMLEREACLIPFIFGVLRAGAAYVPIDPHYPSERITSILSGSGLKVLVTRGSYGHNGLLPGGGLVDLDLGDSEIRSHGTDFNGGGPRGSDLAYVIYTSGSTGVPKGVMIEHHSVVNRLLWMQKSYPLEETDVLLQKTPIVFDVSVWELFWWSLTGASVCVLEAGGEKEPQAIIRAVETERVSTLHFVPSMLHAFLYSLDAGFDYGALSGLRQVFSSGEALRPEQVEAFGEKIHRNCGSRLVNLYGPTEATVDVSYYECSFTVGYRSVPIGRPIDNIQLYILNGIGALSPLGVTGELYIGGAGVGRGYLNNRGLTAEKFVGDPFSGGVMYRTGDLARWMVDGNIEYLGRTDQQVKLRGFRIELGEIESQLNSHPDILQSVVVMRDRGGEDYLAAYYLSAMPTDAENLILYLLNKLPGYMVPSQYIRLDEIPLTPNGKLDTKALPLTELMANNDLVGPANEIEEKLVKIWSDVLKIDKDLIGVNSNFFELGGHSINIITLAKIINNEFGSSISVAQMFSLPSIKSIENFLVKGDETIEKITIHLDETLDEANANLKLITNL